MTVTSSDGGAMAFRADDVRPPLPLPFALAVPQIGWNTRIVRSALTEQLHAPYVDLRRSWTGLPRRRILVRYLLPVLSPRSPPALATSVEGIAC